MIVALDGSWSTAFLKVLSATRQVCGLLRAISWLRADGLKGVSSRCGRVAVSGCCQDANSVQVRKGSCKTSLRVAERLLAH